MDNVNITGDLKVKDKEFYYSKKDQWGVALKKSFFGADLVITENDTLTYRDSKTN